MVVDVLRNLNTPYFINSPYAVTIAETTLVGQSIFNLNARDDDQLVRDVDSGAEAERRRDRQTERDKETSREGERGERQTDRHTDNRNTANPTVKKLTDEEIQNRMYSNTYMYKHILVLAHTCTHRRARARKHTHTYSQART